MTRDDFPKKVAIKVSAPSKSAREKYGRVTPGVARVAYGGAVTFTATRASGALTVFVPRPPGAPKIFPRLRSPLFRIPIGTSRTLHVLPKEHRTEHPREYPYSVYCEKHNCFSKGSLPRMMVGP